MKCSTLILAFVLLLTLQAVTVSAQTFQQCADVNENNVLSISDLSKMFDAFLGGPALPAGRGDIDLRQNYDLGDLRYFAGYLFLTYPEGGCPPFSDYTLLEAPDTLYLPEAIVPDGSGSMMLPIFMSNTEPVSELLVTATIAATNCNVTVDYVTTASWEAWVLGDRTIGNELTMLWASSGVETALPPGLHTIAYVFINYSGSTNGTVSLLPANFGPYRFIHQVYGNMSSASYAQMSIGVPHVIVSPATALPAMSVSPDSMYFATLAGSGDPAPQSFDLLSSGNQFDWTSTQPSWLQVTPSTGVSGATVSVQPLTASLNPGTHVGTIVVSSAQAYNSPKSVKVVLRIQPQYPAFDANCDGLFNISDIVYLIQYIFGGPAPCDPYGNK